MEKITAEGRVTDLKVQPFAYRENCSLGSEGDMMIGGESVVLKASGFWETGKDHYPVSLHMTVYPGHGIIPALGDNLSVTVERGK